MTVIGYDPTKEVFDKPVENKPVLPDIYKLSNQDLESLIICAVDIYVNRAKNRAKKDAEKKLEEIWQQMTSGNN